MLRTREAFGKSICPHLFRDIAVTELVDVAPEEIGIAPDLLGHADLKTTQKYYIQAVGMQAHARVQEVIANRRRAATSRDSTGTSGARRGNGRCEPHNTPRPGFAGLVCPAAGDFAGFNRDAGDGRLDLAAGPGPGVLRVGVP